MRTLICVIACLLIASSAAVAMGPGMIETGFGGMFHLSPEPWQVNANAHVVYFMNPMMGFGPYLWVQKTGDLDVEYIDYTVTYKSATYYNLGILGKMYLPFPMKGGRVLPFVEAGLGLETVSKPEEVVSTLADEVIEEETESKMAVTARFGFDYWLTKNWTVWVAYHGSKVFADEEDGYTEDVTDFRHGVRLGIATFLTP